MKLAIEGLQFYAYHGYYEHERAKGGRYEIDVYINTEILQGAYTDNLADTINYEKIITLCQDEMQQSSHLIEHLAQRIITRLATYLQPPHPTAPDTAQLNPIKGIKVRISKFDVPVGLPIQRTFVELEQIIAIND